MLIGVSSFRGPSQCGWFPPGGWLLLRSLSAGARFLFLQRFNLYFILPWVAFHVWKVAIQITFDSIWFKAVLHICIHLHALLWKLGLSLICFVALFDSKWLNTGLLYYCPIYSVWLPKEGKMEGNEFACRDKKKKQKQKNVLVSKTHLAGVQVQPRSISLWTVFI